MQESRKLSSSQWCRTVCEGDIGKWILSVADAIVRRKIGNYEVISRAQYCMQKDP